MPSVLLPRSPREILALRSWRDPSQLQHTRSRSTVQSIKTCEEDPRDSAFLYGGSINLKSESVAAKQPPAQTFRVSSKKSPQEVPQLDGKRRAKTTPEIPSVRQRYKEPSPLLQDEDSIQDQIVLPTKEDYPDVPGTVFTNPKAAINNALQGKVSFQTKYIQLVQGRKAPHGWRCTLTCVSPGADDQVVDIGRGETMVSLTDGLTNSLTVPRNPPRSLHI